MEAGALPGRGDQVGARPAKLEANDSSSGRRFLPHCVIREVLQ